MIIHHSENLSTMKVANFLFCLCSVYLSQHFLKWVLCLLYYGQFTSLFKLKFGYWVTCLIRKLSPSWERWCSVSNVWFCSLLLLLLLLRVSDVKFVDILYETGSPYCYFVISVYMLRIVVFVWVLTHLKIIYFFQWGQESSRSDSSEYF